MTENDKYCKICGDKALGYNFSVLSCESCKAFFRRHAHKTKKMKCRFQGDCDIIKSNRTLCRFCRLNKCIECGMRKELILTQEQKRERRGRNKSRKEKLKEKNKVKTEVKSEVKVELNEQGEDEDHGITTHYDYGSPNPIYSISQMYDTIDQMLDNGRTDHDMDVECNQTQPAHVISPVPDVTDLAVHEFNDVETVQMVDSGYSSEDPYDQSFESCTSISEPPDTPPDPVPGAEYAVVPVHRPITDYRNNFHEAEGLYLTELLAATNPLKAPISTITSEAKTFQDAIQVLHSARLMDIQCLMSLPNNLSVLNEYSPERKFKIIQHGIMTVHHLRSVTGYFKEGQTEYLSVPTMKDKLSTCLVPLDVMRQTKPYLYSAHVDFFETLSAEWDEDYVILDLLSAIVLLNPVSPPALRFVPLPHRQELSAKQMIYKSLLQRYLLLKYRSEEKAYEKYCRLINAIDLVYVLNENRRRNAEEENYWGNKGKPRSPELEPNSPWHIIRSALNNKS